MKLTPQQAVLAFRELSLALGPLIGEFASFEDEDFNNLQLHFEFEPSEFTRVEKVQLLRYNSILQFELEMLSSIIEYVPYIFRKRNVSEY